MPEIIAPSTQPANGLLKDAAPSSKRLLSLDVMRGITIIGMIIVNTPGSWAHVYPPLLHADWHGLTPTDLVFPFFLFMVGVSITLAFNKRLQKGGNRSVLVSKTVKRALIIFALGMFLALFPKFDFANLRVAGVLPRIAIVYLLCSLLFLQFKNWKPLAILSALLLLAYWLMMTLVPVPGVGAPNLEPGTNLAAWLDSVAMPGRLYRETWDPEGILSTLPAVVTGLSGILVGFLLQSKKTAEHKIIWLMVGGTALCITAYLWHQVFPVNKNLWSSSYVLASSGMASLLLGSLYWLVDVQKYESWTPFFVAFGINAITAYVLHGVLIDAFVIDYDGNGTAFKTESFQALVSLGLSMKLASFIWALLYMLLCFLPIWWMYKKKIIVKI
ncbi:heparan-alpha-glucosaminide N-acetyltransferase domain-containing protein [Porifericola rhodea]|uniref:acyltransferase family protein n=1 Tax=Porifericola rhodea TaxID=930972 RepID=UPI002665C324|nr:heparan-alpha-glucosaminide N-acetyltransferase domain-containing protein [Porifericola rhodea]WKN33369.1 heparan-alpha-glucosaminide N-acetyltransferase domain-containing protein [Porifericola rhodea]